MSRRLIPFFALLAVAVPSHAWLASGHEQIADIAWTQLSQASRNEIREILKSGDAEFVPASDSENDVRRAFRRAATWADWAKEHKDGSFEELVLAWNAKYQPGYDAADTDREAHRCKRWHYFDIPIRFKGSRPGVEGSNALIAMTTARYEFAILGRQSPKDRKSQCWWLYWLEHVIGDLHQPLHCVSSYEFEATGDAGGNLFRLGVGTPDNPDRMTNLHFLWDRGIASSIDAETGLASDVETVTTRWVAANRPTDETSQNLEFQKWIESGAKTADGFVYSGIERNGKPTADYMEKLNKISQRQAVLAGFRLAREIELGLNTLGQL